MGWLLGIPVIKLSFLAIRIAPGILANFHITLNTDINYASLFQNGFFKAGKYPDGWPHCLYVPKIPFHLLKHLSLSQGKGIGKQYQNHFGKRVQSYRLLFCSMFYTGKRFILLPPRFYSNDAGYLCKQM